MLVGAPDFKAPIPRERYRVFNRVMWIKPRNNAKSVICPSRRMMRDKDEIMARCRAIKGENPPGWSGPPEARQNFTRIWERNWYELQPAQFWDCDDVEPRLDADQCEWDDRYRAPSARGMQGRVLAFHIAVPGHMQRH